MTNSNEKTFLEQLKESEILVPIEITSELPNFDELKSGDVLELEEDLRFKPLTFKTEDDNLGLFLFTGEKEIAKLGRTSVLNFTCESLATKLLENKDLEELFINPENDNSVAMLTRLFIDLFAPNDDKKYGDLDNSKLEELMDIDPSAMTEQSQKELFEAIKNSELLVPVDIAPGPLNEERLEENKPVKMDEQVIFRLMNLENNGRKILPLFTSADALKQLNVQNAVKNKATDIAESIIESDVDEIVINPNTPSSLGMAKESFVYYVLEDQFKQIFDVENDLKEYAVPLEENTKFYLRSETPFMEEESEEDIFTAEFPFKVSSRDVYHTEYPYLNVLVVPKGTMYLYLGRIIDDPETQSDVILAPVIKFKLEETQENNTFIWKAIEQDFN